MNLFTDQSSEKFSTHDRINIASLNPQTPTTRDSHIEATVALVWPYSSSHGVLSLLLAERDVRLRRVTGQVKVTFHGRCAKEVAKTQVGIGDLVLLDLSNVSYTQAGDSVSTPGKKVSYNLEYHTGLRLEVRRGAQESISVDIIARSPSPTIPLVTSFNFDTPRTTRAVDVTRTRFSSSYYQSPRAASHRVSSGTFLDASLDPFAEDDGYIVGKGRKRTKYARRSGAWKLVDGTEEIDTGAAAVDTAGRTEELSSEVLLVEESDNNKHDQLTIEETSLTNGNHLPVDDPVTETVSFPRAGADATVLEPTPMGTPEVYGEVLTELVRSPALPPYTSPPLQVHEIDEDIELSEQTISLDPGASSMPSAELSEFSPPVLHSSAVFDASPELSIPEALPPQLSEELHSNQMIILEPESTIIEESSLMYTTLASEQAFGEDIDQDPYNIKDELSVAEETVTTQTEISSTDDPDVVSVPEDDSRGLDVTEEVLPVLSNRSSPAQEDITAVETESVQGSIDHSLSIPGETEGDQVDLDALQSQIDDQIEDDLFSGTPDEVIEDDDMYGPAISKLREVDLIEVEIDEAFRTPVEDGILVSQQVGAVGFSEGPIPSSQDAPQPPPDNITTSQPDDSHLEEDESQIPVIPPEALEPPSSPVHVRFGSMEDDATVVLQLQPRGQSIDSDTDSPDDPLSDVNSELSERPLARVDSTLESSSQRESSAESTEADDDELPLSQQQVSEAESLELVDTSIIDSGAYEQPSPPDASVIFVDTRTDQILTPPATQQLVSADSHVAQFRAETLQQFPLSPIPTQETASADAPVPLMYDHKVEQSVTTVESDGLPIEEEVSIKPRRASQRLMRKSFAGGNVGVEYFTPQNDARNHEKTSTSPDEDKIHEIDSARPSTLVEFQPTTIVEQDETLSQASPQATDTSVQQSTEPSQPLGGTTTSLSYFPHLASLEEHYGHLVDIMAINTSASSSVQKAKSGPRDNYTTLHLSDPSLSNNTTTTLTAQIFRPRKTALPLTNKGDVILLRDLKVQSNDHKPFLLSTETSAWAVFSPRLDTFQIAVDGPPVEYGFTEIAYCERLVQWWKTQERDDQEQEHEREHRIDNSTALQSSPVPTPISPRVTRSQMRKSATLDNEIAPVDIDLANSNNYAAYDTEVRDRLTPLLPPSAAQVQADMSSPTTSVPGTSSNNNNRSAAARRRSTRRSESVVHELRDGTKYVDGGDGKQNLVHELRDGATYVDE